MPSSKDLPPLEDLLTAYGEGVMPEFRDADLHRGSGYDLLGGTMAVLMQREAQRDRDLFRAACFHTADGQDLTDMVKAKDGIDRIVDSYGTGTMVVLRANTSAGAGTFLAGTRIVAQTVSTAPLTFAVLEDTYVAASSLTATIPVRATVVGPDGACTLTASQATLTIDDPLWDSSWTVQRIVCEQGTLFEKAPVFRARVRQARQDARTGYPLAIETAAKGAGAANVILFDATTGVDVLGEQEDSGLSVCYVADASYATSKDLIRAVTIALDSADCAGCPIEVFGMQLVRLRAEVVLTLWDRASLVNLPVLTQAVQTVLSSFFDGPDEGYLFRIDAMRGDVLALTDVVSDAAIVLTDQATGLVVSEPTLTPGQWPSPLPIYVLSPRDVTVSLA